MIVKGEVLGSGTLVLGSLVLRIINLSLSIDFLRSCLLHSNALSRHSPSNDILASVLSSGTPIENVVHVVLH